MFDFYVWQTATGTNVRKIPVLDYSASIGINLDSVESWFITDVETFNEAIAPFTLFSVTDTLGVSAGFQKNYGTYEGGVVTKYEIFKNNTLVKCYFRDFAYTLSRSIPVGAQFLDTNPSLYATDGTQNFNTSLSGKFPPVINAVAMTDSPVPYNGNMPGYNWGGPTANVTINALELKSSAEIIRRLLEEEGAPFVRWVYTLENGQMLPWLSRFIADGYPLNNVWEIPDKYLPDDFSFVFDNTNRVTKSFVQSPRQDTRTSWYYQYSHKRVASESASFAASTNVDSLQSSAQGYAIARAMEQKLTCASFSVTIPNNEKLMYTVTTTGFQSVKFLDPLCFVKIKTRMCGKYSEIWGIVTKTKNTLSTTELEIDNALLYYGYQIGLATYLNDVADTSPLDGAPKNELFTQIAKTIKNVRYSENPTIR